ncbi:hypothetical protein J5J83_05950 [Azoarcus sp. L1K30]|uniref:hypothetical protein n=1 Tax=Azoarcus sp. L1K30 TaxID=2820277 RepID=UPI001B81B07C|nr:hypothetical protein [Azoarcus sp. L1K30]MBR0565659.1 hypothetical protein [Azoarcus sp. L1K30]
MDRTETKVRHPIIQQMALTQALARAEWDAAQRILNIHHAGVRRLMNLPSGLGKNEKYTARGDIAELTGWWADLYRQSIANTMEVSAISMSTLSEIQTVIIKSSHEIIPLLQGEWRDEVEHLSRAMASTMPAGFMPAHHAKAA